MDKIKVLMIDDDIEFLELVKLNLEETGEFEIRTENKGTVALSAALIFNPDIILLDIVMGDQDGSFVAKQLKNNPKTKNIPIIYLSCIIKKSEESLHSSLLDKYPCLAKPASTEKIINYIKNNLKK